MTTIAAAVLMLPKDLLEYGKSLAATALFSSNIQFWRAAGYFDTTSATNPLLHTWSLGVEEQFYIFFPLLMMLLFRTLPRTRLAVIAVLALASFLLSCITLDRLPDFTFYLLPTRAWELLVGSLLSFREISKPRPAVGQICSLAGFGAIFLSAFMLNATSPFPGASALPSVAAAALIIYAGLGGTSTAVGRLLSTPPFRFIGLRSYSLYLWHWPILVFYTYVTNSVPTGLTAVGLLTLALIAASLSFRFVEQPWRRRPPQTPIVVAPLAGVAAMACFFVLGRGGVCQSRLPAAAPEEVRKIAARADSAPPRECLTRAAEDVDEQHLCRIGDETTEPRWVLWGDSHGWALKGAFSSWLANRRVSAWVINSPGCPALSGVSRDSYETDCKAVGKAALDFVLTHRVTDVILVSAWTNWFSQHTDFVDDQSRQRSRAESTAAITRGFPKTVSGLREGHVNVWVFDPLPQAKGMVPDTLAKRLLFGGDRPLAYSAEEYNKRNKDYFNALESGIKNICGRFELERELCASGSCAIENSQGPLYFDNHHPAAFQTEYFSALLSRNMTRECH